MSNCGIILQGGLANRLFQYAFIYSYAKKYNKNFGYVHNVHNGHSNIDYFTEVFPEFKYIQLNNPYTNCEEPGHMCLSYMYAPNFDKDVYFLGYFQNEKYFEEYKDEFLQKIKLPPLKFGLKENAYFLHIRRGDYVNNKFHDINLMEYYTVALNYIKSKTSNFTVYIVSDDINYCKENKIFEDIVEDIVYVEGLNELETLQLMKNCKLGGICANSSFSWWGGYLIESKDKTVIFPSKWVTDNTYPVNTFFKGSYVIDLDTKDIRRVIQ
jgi:hypothetical protein